MYIIGLFIMSIGIISAVLGVFLFNRIFTGTRLSTPLSIFMILICFWQIDVGVLYFHELLPQNVILFLFKLFRGAIIFGLPIVIYVSYITYSRNSYINKKKNILEKVISVVLSRPTLIITLILSVITYIVNWTSYGITDFYKQQLFQTEFFYYYPVYGVLNKTFFSILAIIVFGALICSFLALRYIFNKPLQNFMRTFIIFTFLVIGGGVVNLQPEYGSLGSSAFVIAFTLAIMVGFTRMYLEQLKDYNNVIQRERKLEYLGSLSASLIHEIRNPLHHIKNYSYVITKTQDLSNEGKDLFSHIENSTEQLEAIVESFTEYINTNKLEYKIENLNEIIEHAISLTKGNQIENNVQVEFENTYEKINVKIHKPYITQVFVNLIKNSTESIPEERAERKIIINIEFVEDSINVNLHDTGKGISQRNWEKIFNPFISNKRRGMGLGLAFSKKIMLEHKGDLKIVDSNSNGTHFRIIIPKNAFGY